jgi:hypothetical protein
MPEWDADVLEVLIGQIAEDRDIDHVLGKALSVLRQTELFEPITNIQHRSGRRTLASTIPIANPLAAVTRELAAEKPPPDTPVVSLRPCTLYGKNTLAFLGAAVKVHAIEITASSPKAEYLGRVMSDLRSLASSQGYTSNRDSASSTRRS